MTAPFVTEEMVDEEVERIMSMSDEDLRAEMLAEGLDQDAEAARLGAVIKGAIAEHDRRTVVYYRHATAHLEARAAGEDALGEHATAVALRVGRDALLARAARAFIDAGLFDTRQKFEGLGTALDALPPGALDQEPARDA